MTIFITLVNLLPKAVIIDSSVRTRGPFYVRSAIGPWISQILCKTARGCARKHPRSPPGKKHTKKSSFSMIYIYRVQISTVSHQILCADASMYRGSNYVISRRTISFYGNNRSKQQLHRGIMCIGWCSVFVYIVNNGK